VPYVRTVYVNATQAQVHAAVARAVRAAGGRGGGGAAARALQIRVGLSVLTKVKQAFLLKARGGSDVTGLRWKPLAPLTIALRRAARKGKKKGAAATGLYEILRDTGLLYNSLSPAILAGNRPPPVSPPRAPKQVFRVSAGSVTVGTNRKWAWTHHQGLPARSPPLPKRPLWPDPAHWPAAWWDTILEQATLGMMDLILFLLVNP